jgi:hypothetical protein
MSVPWIGGESRGEGEHDSEESQLYPFLDLLSGSGAEQFAVSERDRTCVKEGLENPPEVLV